jgi:hypothetical protein
MAILPRDPSRPESLLEGMHDSLAAAYADSTNRTDASHMRAWREVCRELDTPVWRTDMAANSSLDPVGYRREMVLLAVAFLRIYATMSPRSKTSPAANPRSALQKLMGVAREHKKRGFKMAPLTLAMQVMAGQVRLYVDRHGVDCLAPARKRPLTNDIILRMLATSDGTTARGLCVDWSSYFWKSVRATFSTMAELGLRKGDISEPTADAAAARPRTGGGRHTFAALRWHIKGVVTAHPSAVQLHTLIEGDGVYWVFASLKNDQFGEHFGSKPAYLPFSSASPRNACRSLAALELAAAACGLQGGARSATPLFGPRFGVSWHHYLIDSVVQFLLEHGAGLSSLERAQFSNHSWRIYLACALYAAGCPDDKIMALLRWRSKEALAIYARFNDGERSA